MFVGNAIATYPDIDQDDTVSATCDPNTSTGDVTVSCVDGEVQVVSGQCFCN